MDAPRGREDGARAPRVRLRPKMGGRFFAGAPWVYADELVMDRRTKALEPGVDAVLEDAARVPLGRVAVNPRSQIGARLLDVDPEAVIDAEWLHGRLRRALDLRERLYDAPFYRLVHAEADGLPGVVVDRFGDAVVVQPNAAWIERRRDDMREAMVALLQPTALIWSGGSRSRSLEGLEPVTATLHGGLDGPVPTPLNGAIYLADLTGGQKTGLFFDQRETQAAVAALAGGGRVLDVFCHVGGFALAALAAGAREALAVDSSASALALAEQGARRSGFEGRLETRRADAFDALKALGEEGRRFEVVVCDPPAFAPQRSALSNGLRAYRKTARLGAQVTAPGGVFCLCSCSHAVSQEALEAEAAAAFRALRRGARLIRAGGAGPDHPVHPNLAETRYLKSLIYVLD
ncbi:MAG: class I SAM-dependent methyltransferase [Pseudomonadota bacterium]